MKHFKTIIAQITCLAIITLFTVSCSNEGLVPTADNEVSLYEALVANSNASASKGAPKKGTDPIAAIAIGAEFNELVAALSYVDTELGTGLVDLFLNGKDQYTVFAPTDVAFGNLYTALGVNGITEIDPNLVLSVLQYHVTTGRRASNSVVPKNGMRTIETLLEDATFDVYPDLKIMAVGNSASIEVPNISASNGIIHVINAVILPIKVE